jgi:hypothetical protein
VHDVCTERSNSLEKTNQAALNRAPFSVSGVRCLESVLTLFGEPKFGEADF